MSTEIVHCRKGDPCTFSVRVTTGIASTFTAAKFQVRDKWSEASTLFLSVDQTSGIVINHTDGVITVSIGATLTDALPSLEKEREAPAHLRLYNPDDPDDRRSWPIPFLLLPDAIVDPVVGGG